MIISSFIVISSGTKRIFVGI